MLVSRISQKVEQYIIYHIIISLAIESILCIVAGKCCKVRGLSSPYLTKPSHPQDFISNSPYYLLYSSGDVGLENLVLDQLIFP